MKSKSPCELSEKELNEILERCNSTTRGPWRSYVEGRDHLSGDHFIMTGESENRGEDIYLSGATTADQDFIAHAKQDVPRLVNEVRRLKQLLLDNSIC
jgi:hypothetical protein